MTTTRDIMWLAIAVGLLGCRTPARDAESGVGPTTSMDIQSEGAVEPPSPGRPDVYASMTLIEDELGASARHRESRSWGFRDGVWREAIVFVIDGKNFCKVYTPEQEWEDCDSMEKGSSEQAESLGVAVIAYTKPDEPRVEHLRVLRDGCQVWGRGDSCADAPGTTYTKGKIASNRMDIQIAEIAISDVDGDNKRELVFVTTYVEMASEVGEDGDSDVFYRVEAFNRRRLTVLRDDLTRQLDIDIGQEMYERAPGMVADNDVVVDQYLVNADAATVSWCEIDVQLGLAARECLEQVCASPTTRARFAYDPAKDLYTNATIEVLRPIVDDWDGCRK